MIQIPMQLKNKAFKFALLKSKEKIPFEKEWQERNNYSYDDPKLLDHLKNKGNYGICCGFSGLTVIDFDNKQVQDELLEKLPKTFTVKTGRGLLHKYYYCDKPKNIKVLNDNNETLIDVQGQGKQIVAPGSIHPNGNEYTIEDDSNISNITHEELRALLFPYTYKKEPVKSKLKQGIPDSIVQEIKSKITIRDVLDYYGIDTGKNPTTCPLGHASKGGKCLSFTNNLWKCFHCDKGGDIFSLVVEKDGLDFINAKSFLANLAGIKIDVGISTAIVAFTNYLDMAKQFVKIQPIYYDKSKMWWLWDFENSCWIMIDETDLMNKIDKSMSRVLELNTISNNTKNQILEALRRTSRLLKPKEIPKTWVQFKDKIVDILTEENFNATSEWFVTNPIPWKIGDSEETPTMDRIFEEWVGEEYVKTLYEIIAYCLLPDYPVHRIFCLNGAGLNGKGKYSNLIIKFIGKNNSCSSDLDLLIVSRFEMSKIHKKLLCCIGETNFSAMKKTSLLKRMCGGDLIGFEFKNKLPFDDYNYAKIIISTNALPVTFDKTIGFYRRWLLINFPKQFDEYRDILLNIPDVEYNNLAKKCIGILKNLLIDRKFTNEGSIDDRRRAYEELSNPIMLFINSKCERNVNDKISFSDFKEELDSFLNDTGRRIMNHIEVGRILSNEGFERKKINVIKEDENYKDYNTTATFILGLGWNSKKSVKSVKNNTNNTNNTQFTPKSIYKEVGINNDTIDTIDTIECKKCGLKVSTLDEEELCEFCVVPNKSKQELKNE
ncbi:hypothetical protein LCGC14_0534770 [marine sediment metagenome]|uniref:SF3 helicase domain-containing protein n=1 Tax=marine sediment metagenome TaxID=412755 RepID=A0A0F9UG22_9ZZZZ